MKTERLKPYLYSHGQTSPFSPSQDFFIMFIHHLATVSLISFSYVNNMVRIGSLVMCIHDASDFLLEVGRGSVLQRQPWFYPQPHVREKKGLFSLFFLPSFRQLSWPTTPSTSTCVTSSSSSLVWYSSSRGWFCTRYGESE